MGERENGGAQRACRVDYKSNAVATAFETHEATMKSLWHAKSVKKKRRGTNDQIDQNSRRLMSDLANSNP